LEERDIEFDKCSEREEIEFRFCRKTGLAKWVKTKGAKQQYSDLKL
jgi:hypothetical protein